MTMNDDDMFSLEEERAEEHRSHTSRKLEKDRERMRFARQTLRFPDFFLFDAASKLSADYDGGMWAYVLCDEGTKEQVGYAYPDDDKTYHCESSNYYAADLTAEAFGIYVTAYVYLQMSWQCWQFGEGQYFSDMYYLLRDYWFDVLPEDQAAAIHWLLD